MILVTGGMGFIGLHTARRLLDAGEDVVLTRYRRWRLPDFLAAEQGRRVHVEALDLADGWALLDVLRRHRVDGIVHLAAPALGTAPAQEVAAATRGLVNVLEAARQHGVRRLSVASSLAVYSNAGPGPWHEDLPLPVASDSHTAAVNPCVRSAAMAVVEKRSCGKIMTRSNAIPVPR